MNRNRLRYFVKWICIQMLGIVAVFTFYTPIANAKSTNYDFIERRKTKSDRNIVGLSTSLYHSRLHELVDQGRSGYYYTIGAHYTRFIDKHWSASFSGTSLWAEVFNYYINGRYYSDWISYEGLSLQVKTHYHFIHKGNWSLYTGGGLGYMLADGSSIEQLNQGFAYQIDIVGIQGMFLWEHLGFNGQFGFGKEGVVQIGIQYSW